MLKVGLLGKMASGKTELAQYFINTYKAQRVAFADALKADIVQYGLTPDGAIVKSRDRALLQKYGQLRRGEILEINMQPFRMLYNVGGHFVMEEIELETKFTLGVCYANYWVDKAIDKATALAASSNVMIEDVRRNNEAEAMKKNGFTIFKVLASDEVRKDRLIKRDGHYHESSLHDISESEVDYIPYDFGLDNNQDNDNSKKEMDFWIATLLKH